MTAPDDPFRTPPPGGRQDPDPSGRPTDPYGAGGQSYDRQQPGGSHGQPHGDQPYGSQPYGSQPHGGPGYGEQRPAARNGLGIGALVVGILALLTGPFLIGGLLGVVAVVLGVMGRGRAKRGEATNGGMALAGIVLGVLGIVISALAVLGLVTLFNSAPVSTLTECLQEAGSDPAAQQECQVDFEDEVGG